MDANIMEQTRITSAHLKRKAYLYIRQSSVRQVREHKESTLRQYDLKRRAVALGWPESEIVVIDDDLGRSAAFGGRGGFAELASEVGLGHAGMVMSLEASRLARNNGEWHRLLEIRALSGSLLLDEDGIYDPGQFNDRLLLGLKGTMSEVELHPIRARLKGGTLNKAARGELKLRLPIGLVYDPNDRVVLDPDSQVVHSLRLFFKTFRRTGSAMRTVREFHQKKIGFPRREFFGPRKGELIRGSLTCSRANYILHNPRYAGAYVFGRRKHVPKLPDGKYDVKWLSRDQRHTLIEDAHEGYISFAEYEENQKRPASNRVCKAGTDRPPGEGGALLQGLAVRGGCGREMNVRYNKQSDGLKPRYECAGEGRIFRQPRCQTIPGGGIDETIGKLLAAAMSPLALEVTLSVREELGRRIEEADALGRKQVERIGYEADPAQKRFMNVDPENRLVADVLESEWNTKLIEYREAKKVYERKREEDLSALNEKAKSRILELTGDFKKLWNNPATPDRERKRMVRLLIEDVTLVKDERLTLKVRFKGGALRILHPPKPQSSWERWRIDPGVVEEIDRLLEKHTYGETAVILNERGFKSGTGKSFDGQRVKRVRLAYKLKDRHQRLRERGYLTAEEAAQKLGISSGGLRAKRAAGRLSLKSFRVNDYNQRLYEDPDWTAVETETNNPRETGESRGLDKS
ncbi:MAG: recombinase family protein [bacterium]|nr:recombinase family protein [bacterium]